MSGLVPTAGIDSTRAAAFIRVGAFAVGVGGCVVDIDAIRARDAKGIRRAATDLLRVVNEARTRQ